MNQQITIGHVGKFHGPLAREIGEWAAGILGPYRLNRRFLPVITLHPTFLSERSSGRKPVYQWQQSTPPPEVVRE